MCLSEHPLGTVKWYEGATLSEGKEKAAAKPGLGFLAYI
jgi:transposase